MRTDTGSVRHLLHLGALALEISDYQVQTEVPVLRQTLCDGTEVIRLLPAKPCILRVKGIVLQQEGGTYLSALQNALRLHSSFDTEFAGMTFTGLQITAAECTAKDYGRTAAVSLTLIGGIGA